MKPIYKIFFFVSVALTLTSVVLLFMYGLNLGVDFKGGTVMELSFTISHPTNNDIRNVAAATKGVEDLSVSQTSQGTFIVRAKALDEQTHQSLLTALKGKYSDVVETRYDSIGPSIGQELKSNSLTAIIVTLIAIVIYLSFVFRAMSRVLPSVALGIAGIIALIHDLLIPLGVFALLSHLGVVEISAVFVAAALTILGYSISDTVVVFDRIRENVIRFGSKESFPQVVHRSVLQTLTRSINTSMTTLLALVAIFLFGGESVKYFALALIIGVVSGTYSSIFIASPILVWWSEWRSKRRK